MPRAVGSGWTRESEVLAAAEAAPRSRGGGRSLMGRLRTRRQPESELDDQRESAAPPHRDRDPVRGRNWARRGGEHPPRTAGEPYDVDGSDLSYADAYAGGAESLEPRDGANGADERAHGADEHADGADEQLYGYAYEDLAAESGHRVAPPTPPEDASAAYDALGAAAPELRDGDVDRSFGVLSETALTHFNASEAAGRIAGIARSLGEPEIAVRPLDEQAQRISIVVAWELCWYRYEVDMGGESPLVALSGDGMELDELPVEDRAVNARADERGELSLF